MNVRLKCSRSQNSGCCIIVFLKAPEEGHVKSRLAETVGKEAACRLYRNFVLDLLETFGRLNQEEVALKLYYFPPESESMVTGWLGSSYSYAPQQGRDLGERMQNAFQACFSEGFHSVLLTGSDIPDLPNQIVKEGFESLQGHDAVIGPSPDGGYYLIGFKPETFIPEIFEGVSWGTEGVFKRAMDVFRQKKANIVVLPSWRDIDTYEDLKEMFGQNKNSLFGNSRTMRYLRSHSTGKTIMLVEGGDDGTL